MRNLIKKSLLMGIGAASLTKEKVGKLLDEFVKKRAITTKDGKWLANQVLKEISKNAEKIEKLGRLQKRVLSAKAKSLEKRGRKAAKIILKEAQRELE